jgi:hypothetical protein
MLIDLRYHATSLIAVFLALALGLIIGGSLSSDDALVKYQENLISRLEAENKALRGKQEVDESTLLALRKDKSTLESNLDILAVAYFNQVSQSKKLALEGSETLLGYNLETIDISNSYDCLFSLKEGGELAKKVTADNKGFVVEVPKNIKLWELALYLNMTEEK